MSVATLLRMRLLYLLAIHHHYYLYMKELDAAEEGKVVIHWFLIKVYFEGDFPSWPSLLEMVL